MTTTELRALLARATPGPWRSHPWVEDQQRCRMFGDKNGSVIATFHDPKERGVYNLELVEAMHANLASLLDVVEAAQRVICSDRVVSAWPQEHAEAIAAFDAAVARLNGDQTSP